jgi:2-keto-4-pentenoate hydratase/2-oxohepta-3-ene-1,7-dioic acid hydratase in catechol pathway
MASFSIATLSTPSGPKAAIGLNKQYYLLSDVQPLLRGVTVLRLLQEWDTAFPMLQTLADAIAGGTTTHVHAIGQQGASLLSPVMYPNKLLAVAANYSDHAKEMGLGSTKSALMPFFLRPPTTTIVGPGQTVSIPKSTKQFDWECELTVVVGRQLRYATREDAAKAIAGYTIGLDLSCRDLIPAHNGLQVDLVRGKAQDTMAPCGPHLVPAQFVPDTNNLHIQLSVNDEKMMDASTDQMISKVDEILSVISENITLEPGDMVMTGSPGGSAGVHGNRWLKPNDRIHAEIEGVGALDVRMRDD